eukprot:SAG31_NODE_252_length_19068_cov_18.307713_17_plen_77_part_00
MERDEITESTLNLESISCSCLAFDHVEDVVSLKQSGTLHAPRSFHATRSDPPGVIVSSRSPGTEFNKFFFGALAHF